MNIEVLQKIGLSKNEAKIYLVLVKKGSSSVKEISKSVDIHRVNIYDALERLQEKGFIGAVIKANKKYFEAAHPEKIKDLIKEKEEDIKDIKSALPSLIKLYESSEKKQEVYSFKGILGTKTVLDDILTTRPKEVLDFGSSKGLPFYLPTHFKIWDSKRIKLKIPLKIITSKKIKETIPKRRLQTIRFLGDRFNNFSSTIIFGDKVAIFMWSEDPLAILIKSPEIAEDYRNYFYSLWKLASK